jgi:hypothetical protein
MADMTRDEADELVADLERAGVRIDRDGCGWRSFASRPDAPSRCELARQAGATQRKRSGQASCGQAVLAPRRAPALYS